MVEGDLRDRESRGLYPMLSCGSTAATHSTVGETFTVYSCFLVVSLQLTPSAVWEGERSASLPYFLTISLQLTPSAVWELGREPSSVTSASLPCLLILRSLQLVWEGETSPSLLYVLPSLTLTTYSHVRIKETLAFLSSY